MMISSAKTLAIVASSRRKQLGLTQAAVAERVGLKQKTVSAFENHPERVKLSTAFLILSALHLDLKAVSKNEEDNDTHQWAW